MKTFTLPQLPYAYDALEPVIDKTTMEIHHTKHHQAYTDNLNTALGKHPELEVECLGQLLSNINQVPEDIRQAVINNGGGFINHKMFWEQLAPVGTSTISPEFKEILEKAFGSYDEFVTKFSQVATTRFGSGWAWLVVSKCGCLDIISTPNQDSPLMDGKYPLLGLDVWEHAYYLKYQNRRAEYIKNFFEIINWDVVFQRYQKYTTTNDSQHCCTK